jgi:hypothetical protein
MRSAIKAIFFWLTTPFNQPHHFWSGTPSSHKTETPGQRREEEEKDQSPVTLKNIPCQTLSHQSLHKTPK